MVDGYPAGGSMYLDILWQELIRPGTRTSALILQPS